MQKRAQVAGFTLIELIVVMLLVALSAGLVVGLQFRQGESVLLQASARELYAFLGAARSQAIFQGQPNLCVYDPVQHQVLTSLQKVLTLDPSVRLAISPDLHSAAPDPNESWPLLYFYADGSASGPSFRLQTSRRALDCAVDPLLGTLTLADEIIFLPEQNGQ